MPGLTGSSTNTNNSSTQSGSSGGTTASSSLPTFNGLNDLMGQLASYSSSSMSNPSAQLAPIRNAGLDQINQSYASAPDTVTQQLASRGYGSSGLEGNSLVQVANAKAGAESGFEGQLANSAIQQSQYGASLANQLLNTDKGTSTQGAYNGSTNGQSNSNSSTTQTPSILNTISGLASLLLTGGGALGLFNGGGGSSAMGGNLTGYQTNGTGIYEGSESNPIGIPGVGPVSLNP